jgi:cytochrome c-type biogenesis protein CcmF
VTTPRGPELATLGEIALVLVFALGVYAAGAGAVAGVRRSRRLMASARNALLAAFGSCMVAVATLLTLTLERDFSVRVVAEHTSRELPLGYTITSLWSSQPGSLLLWLSILTAAGALVLVQNRRRNRELMPWVAATLGVLTAFFAAMAAFVSPAFERVAGAVPTDGVGLDPALQNPYMAIHPPALYLGFVGFSVPFAFAIAALVTGRTDARWLVSVRRWTLVAWAALAVGMLLGAHWAYVEIGWGGYWAWDPVENAALLPWLTGTAFLHSVMVQEKKGMLKVWNLALITGTFALCVFGTFLTRSGVVSSVHSFVESSVGPFLLAFVAAIIACSAALIVWRLPLLRAEHRLESLLSREATFLFNNLLLLALAFAVLWGVVFPILSEAARGVRSTVSTPYYDFFTVAFGLPLLLLIGIGPLIAWRRASAGSLARTFRWPALSAVAAAGLLALAGLASSVAGLVALSLCAFVTVTIGLEFARGASARRAVSDETWPRAVASLIARNRRRYGGYVVHLAVVLLVVGVTASSAYSSSEQARLARGESIAIGSWTLTYMGLAREQGPNYEETHARLALAHDGEAAGTLTPGRRFFPADGRVSSEVGIRSRWTTGEDIYAILESTSTDGDTAVVKVLLNPMVNLIWLAGAVFLLGAGIAMWPDPREARVLARRYAGALAREA